jgi:hypothetical protein
LHGLLLHLLLHLLLQLLLGHASTLHRLLLPVLSFCCHCIDLGSTVELCLQPWLIRDSTDTTAASCTAMSCCCMAVSCKEPCARL